MESLPFVAGKDLPGGHRVVATESSPIVLDLVRGRIRWVRPLTRSRFLQSLPYLHICDLAEVFAFGSGVNPCATDVPPFQLLRKPEDLLLELSGLIVGKIVKIIQACTFFLMKKGDPS